MKTYNYTYPNLEIAWYEFFQHVDVSDLLYEGTPFGSILLSDCFP